MDISSIAHTPLNSLYTTVPTGFTLRHIPLGDAPLMVSLPLGTQKPFQYA